jgi:hypothetical protein
MSNESWNKGNWSYNGNGGVISTLNGGGLVNGADEVDFYGGYLIAESISKANAQLIAAAPELYEALKQVLEDHNLLDYVQTETLYRCEKALAKARGEL